MHILYKYCPPERASILHEHKIAYSHRSALNDVFEMQPSVQLQFSGKLTSPANDRKIVHETLDSALVLCLSETWDNIPMWSYYADGHKGFVIGLAAGHGFFNGSARTESPLGNARSDHERHRIRHGERCSSASEKGQYVRSSS